MNIPRTIRSAASLALLLLLAPAASAQQRTSHYMQEMDAEGSKVLVDVDLLGRLTVSGDGGRNVRIEANAQTGPDAPPDCALSVNQKGDTLEITMPAGRNDSCNREMDLNVSVPRRFDARIVATSAREISVRDVGGFVSGEAGRGLTAHWGSIHASNLHVKGNSFQMQDMRGELIMKPR